MLTLMRFITNNYRDNDYKNEIEITFAAFKKVDLTFNLKDKGYYFDNLVYFKRREINNTIDTIDNK